MRTPQQLRELRRAAETTWPAPGTITKPAGVKRGGSTWARMMEHLVKEGLFEAVHHREFRITQKGRDYLAEETAP